MSEAPHVEQKEGEQQDGQFEAGEPANPMADEMRRFLEHLRAIFPRPDLGPLAAAVDHCDSKEFLCKVLKAQVDFHQQLARMTAEHLDCIKSRLDCANPGPARKAVRLVGSGMVAAKFRVFNPAGAKKPLEVTPAFRSAPQMFPVKVACKPAVDSRTTEDVTIAVDLTGVLPGVYTFEVSVGDVLDLTIEAEAVEAPPPDADEDAAGSVMTQARP